MTENGDAKEPIVLDAEGHVLHDPTRDANPGPGAHHRRAEFKVAHLGKMSLVPKILIGGAFVVLLVLGLTMAGIALGVVIVTFLARSIFRPRRR